MEEFIQHEILGLRTTPNTPLPRPAQCLIVKKIAKRCIATAIGLAEKDLLVEIDGQAAIGFSPKLYLYRAAERRYLFYSRPRHERIELAASGIEIGVELAKTLDAIKVLYDPRKPDYTALEQVWEARDWRSLEKLAHATLAANKERGTPALLFEGAALWESGRTEEGLERLSEYMDKYASWWTMNFTAVGYYCLAMDWLRKGDKDNAKRLIDLAYENQPSEAVARGVEKVTGEKPRLPAPEWVQRRFPVDYSLPRLDGGAGEVSLAATLHAMPKDKLLIVCLLANYRGNGPYNDFMNRFHNYASYFTQYVHALHVITMEAERNAERAHYYQAEDDARAARFAVSILLEPGNVVEAVMPHGSPFVMLLDRGGTVVYEGELDAVELWDTLASVSAP